MSARSALRLILIVGLIPLLLIALQIVAPAQAVPVPPPALPSTDAAVNFWQPLNGPEGGWVVPLAVNQQTGHVFISFHAYGASGSRSFRSTDHGLSWTPILTTGFETRTVVSLVPRGATELFIGTGAQGLYRSNDNGATWTSLTAGYTATLNTLALNPSSQHLFAGTQGQGIFRSIDSGTSWQPANAGLASLAINHFAFNSTGTIFAGSANGGVFSSTTGTTWAPLNTGLTDLAIRALTVNAAGEVFAGTSTSGVFRLNPATNIWTAINTGLGSLEISALFATNGQVFVSTQDQDKLYRSSDNGASWIQLSNGLAIGQNGTVRTRKIAASADGTLFLGSVGGPYVSTDNGDSWTQIISGLDTTLVRRLVVTPSGVIFAATRANGVYVSTDGGETWAMTGPTSSDVFSLDLAPNGDVYAGTYIMTPNGIDTHIYHTSDNGASWIAASPAPGVIANVVTGFGFRGPNEMYAGSAWGSGIISSTDGINWVKAGMTNPTVGLSTLADGTIYAGTEGFGTYRRAVTDTAWLQVGMNQVQAYRFVADSLDNVFAATSALSNGTRGVYRSSNHGYAWTNVFSASPISDIAVANDDAIYAAGLLGVWVSHDHGASWTLINNSGMPAMSVLGLTIAADGYLYAGTTGGGVYRSVLPVNSGIAPTLTIPPIARGAVNTQFSYALLANGTLPITFNTSPLPVGLLLAGDIITGTPSTVVQTMLTITATNAFGSDVQAVGLTIAAAPLVPLIDLTSPYLGQFASGLYSGTNTMPISHSLEGLARARLIQPRDSGGSLSATGKYALLSVGMSNTTQEFCHQNPITTGCNSWTFMGQAAADTTVNHTTLALVNGAKGSQDASTWTAPALPNYDRIRDQILVPQGLGEPQVQVVWVKLSNALAPSGPFLPHPQADAYVLEARLGQIMRALHMRYPNLQMVFISSRIYGGYGVHEPQSYEVGFAIQLLIQAQIHQMQAGTIDPIAGDLNYTTVAPWIAWGPYLWADGSHPRSDGLTWEQTDLEYLQNDYVHPSQSGEHKVGTLLLDFFKASPHTACWFRISTTCGNRSTYLPLFSR